VLTMHLFADIELGQGEFGSVLKGMWRAPSGEMVYKRVDMLVLAFSIARWVW